METPFAALSLQSAIIMDDPPTLEDELDKIVATFGKTYPLRRFRQELARSWERVYPKVPGTEYQEYVKQNISSVKEQYPDKSHGEHMKIVGAMWTLSRPRITGKKRANDAME